MDFVCIRSSEKSEFYLDCEIASHCQYFKDMLQLQKLERREKVIELDYLPSNVVETVIQYLHYKNRYLHTPPEQVPPFNIDPKMALKVHDAALKLKI